MRNLVATILLLGLALLLLAWAFGWDPRGLDSAPAGDSGERVHTGGDLAPERMTMAPLDKYQTGEPPSAAGVPPGTIISPDTARSQRVPPGQSRTRKWPVLDAGEPLPIDVSQWSLTFSGLIEPGLRFDWSEFQALPRTRVLADFHCVTRWSRLGNLWEGVTAREIVRRVRVLPDAQYVLVRAELGWSTNLPLEHFLAEDVLFADRHDGAPLEHEHGGPVRLIVPRLYAWKSAKWVRGVEFLAADRAGFWEQGGYHMRGDPWREERHRSDRG